MAEPPRFTPVPDYPPDLPRETPSGVHRALKTDLNWQGAKLTIAMGVIAVGTAFGAYRAILSEAAAQTDAGIRVHEQRLGTLEEQRRADRVEMNSRLERVEKNQNADHELTLGVSQKLDLMLERFQVRNPAPAPKDAGQ